MKGWKWGVLRWLARLAMLLALLVLLVYGYYAHNVEQNKHFETTFYRMETEKRVSGLRIVLLTDLHLREYGENNQDLVQKIEKLAPDLIAMAGDMIHDDVDDHAVVTRLIAQLVPIAPVFYSAGNHEFTDILYNEDSTLIEDIEAAGAVYLNNTYQAVTVGENTLLVGGICKNAADVLHYSATREMLEAFTQETEFTLLLSHYPEVFIAALADYPVDLALCGHAHGGQIRLPLTQGLYTHDQGFLPKYTSGLNDMQGSQVVISRGLGDSSTDVPRIANRPELVVIDVN